MDSIFGVGLPEFILILVLAGMVMGPERIVRLARSLGVMTARLQSVSRSFVHQLTAEIESVDSGGDLKATLDQLDSLRHEFDELKSEVRNITSGTMSDAGQAAREIKEVQNSIRPPAIRPRRMTQAATQSPRRAVHPPPQLSGSTAVVAGQSVAATGDTSTATQSSLPRRVDVAEDPD